MQFVHNKIFDKIELLSRNQCKLIEQRKLGMTFETKLDRTIGIEFIQFRAYVATNEMLLIFLDEDVLCILL